MKNRKILIVLIIMMFIGTSCGEKNPTVNTYEKPLTEPTYNYEPENENAPPKYEESAWVVINSTDKFGDETSEQTIIGIFDGTFSNSATTNSDFSIGFRIGEKSLGIILFEYGNVDGKVKNIYSKTQYYDISIKDSDGDITNLKGFMIPDSSTIFFHSGSVLSDEKGDKEILLDMLKSGNILRFYIEESDRSITNYLVSVDTSGFADLYESTYQSKSQKDTEQSKQTEPPEQTTPSQESYTPWQDEVRGSIYHKKGNAFLRCPLTMNIYYFANCSYILGTNVSNKGE